MIEKIKCVILGTSAGGQDVINNIVPRLRRDLNINVLIAMHNLPGMNDEFVSLYNQAQMASMKIINGGEFLDGNDMNIYMARSGFHTRIISDWDRRPILINREELNDQKKKLLPNIDELFTSAAETLGYGLLAVILTGTGNDGTEGFKRVKEFGGKTLVQDPSTCAHSGMARSAIESGFTDHIVPLNNIPNIIYSIIKNSK